MRNKSYDCEDSDKGISGDPKRLKLGNLPRGQAPYIHYSGSAQHSLEAGAEPCTGG